MSPKKGLAEVWKRSQTSDDIFSTPNGLMDHPEAPQESLPQRSQACLKPLLTLSFLAWTH